MPSGLRGGVRAGTIYRNAHDLLCSCENAVHGSDLDGDCCGGGVGGHDKGSPRSWVLLSRYVFGRCVLDTPRGLLNGLVQLLRAVLWQGCDDFGRESPDAGGVLVARMCEPLQSRACLTVFRVAF